MWTRGGARFFWRRACRKLRISAPRAGAVVEEVGEESVGGVDVGRLSRGAVVESAMTAAYMLDRVSGERGGQLNVVVD